MDYVVAKYKVCKIEDNMRQIVIGILCYAIIVVISYSLLNAEYFGSKKFRSASKDE